MRFSKRLVLHGRTPVDISDEKQRPTDSHKHDPAEPTPGLAIGLPGPCFAKGSSGKRYMNCWTKLALCMKFSLVCGCAIGPMRVGSETEKLPDSRVDVAGEATDVRSEYLDVRFKRVEVVSIVHDPEKGGITHLR